MKVYIKDKRPQTGKETTLTKMAVVAASFAFGVEDSDILKVPRGDERITMARQTVYWLLRKSGMTYYRISAAMGKDHGAAIHGVKNIENTLELNARRGFAKCVKEAEKYYNEFYKPHRKKEKDRMRKELADAV